jgi:FkbM family methyltransferase
MLTGHLSNRELSEKPYLAGDESDTPSFFTSQDNVRFVLKETSFRQVFEVPEYMFDDLHPHDRVIDLGANVGAFCIRASRYAPCVVAVEPLTVSLLRENIRLNGVPVRVIEGALGDGQVRKVTWDDHEITSPTFPFRRLIEMAGGCDFLKCDCEGAEWQINPSDLAGVRRIEMELHIPPIGTPPAPALLDYIDRYYHYTVDRKPVHSEYGVMGVLHAERK